jgi:hypothetical protein
LVILVKKGFGFGVLGDENLVLEVIAGHEVVVALI